MPSHLESTPNPESWRRMNLNASLWVHPKSSHVFGSGIERCLANPEEMGEGGLPLQTYGLVQGVEKGELLNPFTSHFRQAGVEFYAGLNSNGSKEMFGYSLGNRDGGL